MSNQHPSYGVAPKVGLHIGGQVLDTGSAGAHGHIYPADETVSSEIPLAGAAEARLAVEAAQAAFPAWRRTNPIERGRILRRLAELIRVNAAEFGRLGALDNGTPALFAEYGASSIAADWIEYYANWADKIEGRVTGNAMSHGEFAYTLAEPYGVIGIIITWNGPLISLGMKVAPALAAGNTVVVKPSEMTPYSGELFMRLAKEAGVPDGVLNMIPGSVEAGDTLVRHPLVKKVSFTGGPVTARKILAACADGMKQAVLELGGKSAHLVFPDADLDAATQMGVDLSVAIMSGQGCAFATRMLVHDDVYDEMVERVMARVATINVGDPFDPKVTSGPVVNEAALHRILGMTEKAKRDGAGRLLTGGARCAVPLDRGYFVQPTVFADVDPGSEIAQQEVFGPVLSIIRFRDEEEGVRIANSTNYGLSAYISTRDLSRTLRLAEELVTGVVLVNGSGNIQPMRPFGGLGESGYGREGGREGLDEFLQIKTVGIKL